MTDAGLVVARAITYGALLLTAGLPLYMMTAGRGVAMSPRCRTALVLLAFVGAGASAWWALASIAAMAAVPVAQLDRETVIAVLGATPLGNVVSIRLAALALVVVATFLRWPRILVALPAVVALATAAWTGHAGATEGAAGSLHRLADIVHLLSAGVWLGALAMLLASALGSTDPRELEHRLAGFATTGTAIVVLLLASGIAKALFIAGWPLRLTGLWTLLLGIKLALFAAMLGCAALNRWRLTPALRAGGPAARRGLRLSLAAEASAGLAVVALVAALGVLDPAA